MWQYCLYLQEMCFEYYPDTHTHSHTDRKCVMVCGIALSNSVMEMNFVMILKFSVDKKNQLDVTFCILYFSSNSC